MTDPKTAAGAGFLQEAITGSVVTNFAVSAPASPKVASIPRVEQLVESPEAEFPKQLVNIAIKPASHICYLWVQEVDGGTKEFRACAHNPLVGHIQIEDSINFQRPLQQERLSPRNAWKTMMDLVEKQHRLADWFNSAIELIGKERPPVLIIDDRTGPRIPWEMFHLDMERRIAVGSEMTTVRWGEPISSNFHRIKLENATDCCGQVLAHFDQAEWTETIKSLHQPLLDLKPIEVGPITNLLEQLGSDQANVSLLYLLCHGIDDGQADYALGSEDDDEQRIRRSDLREDSCALLRRSKMIVFMNACNAAGAQQSNDYIYVKRNVALVDIFLTKGACGVIGTLDSIDVTQAARTAQEFITLVKSKPGISIAEALRTLRSNAIGRMPNGKRPTDDQLKDWYHTFLYVFYGHPETKLYLEVGGIPVRPAAVIEGHDD